jgi:hypothetical protein
LLQPQGQVMAPSSVQQLQTSNQQQTGGFFRGVLRLASNYLF